MDRLDPDRRDVVDYFWPYDGPHDADSVATAAAAIPGLVRYLNNATHPVHTLPYAATGYQVTSSLYQSVALLPQLLDQLRTFMETQAKDPTLYDDRHDRPGADTANQVADALSAALVAVATLGESLNAAAQTASHLGNNDPA